MARNEEKAMTLFNRWQTFKKDFHAGVSDKRPFIAQECESLAEAEKWRRELVRDVTKKIAAIHNASLGEHRIRELNDEINKLMRQKHHWEIRIRELGGGDYARSKTQIYDIEGKELPGVPGYKYYGAAKELPGVRELFAEHDEIYEQRRKKRTRADMYKNVTPDYYGYRDDDDGILRIKEQEKEKENVAKALKEFKDKTNKLREDMKRSGGVFGAVELALLEDTGDQEEIDYFFSLSRSGPPAIVSRLERDGIIGPATSNASADCDVPSALSTEEIAAEIMERKRKALLDKLI